MGGTFNLRAAILEAVGITLSLPVVVMAVSEVEKLLSGSVINALRMLNSASVRSLRLKPADRLRRWLVGEEFPVLTYWAGCRRALTRSAKNWSSPLGLEGLPFWRTVAVRA